MPPPESSRGSALPTAERCLILIGGEWQAAEGVATIPVFNPSTGAVIAAAPLCDAAIVDRAVAAAVAALPAWRATPVIERARLLFRYLRLLEEDADAIARIVSAEEGKTWAEARGAVQRGIEVVELACGAPSLLMGDVLPDLAHGLDCEVVREPVGVCAGITPFNFPAMIPLWMFPLALACGNTFILKPSEQVPATAVRLAELLVAAGAPPGVFNLVHGQREAVDRLLTHPDVDAVSFVGSSVVARHVYQTATAAGKRVQAAGGAKNFAIIMPDADPAGTAAALTTSAFGCAGERCMASSVAVAVGDRESDALAALIDAAAQIRVGRVDLPGSDATMGPVISQPHCERVQRAIAQALGEGAVPLLDGRALHVPEAPGGYFLGPTILDQVGPASPVVREEIFGPVLAVLHAPDLDAAIAAIARSGYGNGASIYTTSGRTARTFARTVNVGMVGINVGVPAAQALFPFAGRNASFFGDLHMQGAEGLAFYTRPKVTMARWDA